MGPGSSYDTKALKEDKERRANECSTRQDADNKTPFMACGTVVDTNDPQQMGRIRALVPSYGDSEHARVDSLPWAQYVSAFGGSVGAGSRGVSHDESATTQGHVAYGMWAIPKVGATVLVACLEGDPEQRVWLGCIFGQNLNSTLPHGRFGHSPALRGTEVNSGGSGSGGAGGQRSTSPSSGTAGNAPRVPIGNTATAPNPTPSGPNSTVLSGESPQDQAERDRLTDLNAEHLRSTNVPDTPENQALIAKLKAREAAQAKAASPESLKAQLKSETAAELAANSQQPGGATSRDAAIVAAAKGGKVKTKHDIPTSSIVETTKPYSLEEKAAAIDALAALEESTGTSTSLQNLPGRGPELTIVPQGGTPASTANFEVVGPLSSSGKPIEPLHTNITAAFTKNESMVEGAPLNAPRANFEIMTRGVDQSVSAVPRQIAGAAETPVVENPDDRAVEFTEPDGRKMMSTQGYRTSRIESDLQYPGGTGNNNDSQVYSLTSPGFHSIAMDDSLENNRLKLRTCCGHQIIMDDTNERIYINTAGGNNWIEIDAAGRIDIFSTKGLSITGKDINITAAETFRVHAKQIHLNGAEGIRLNSGTEVHIKTSTNMFIDAGTNVNVLAGSDMRLTSGGGMHSLAGGQMLDQGSVIHHNGPGPTPADPAKPAFLTSRVPEHEPWARTMMSMAADGKDDDGNETAPSHKPELTYIDKLVGRKERTEIVPRNPNWHR